MKMRLIPAAVFAVSVLSSANAQEPVRIGVAAPLSGPNAVLGSQVAAGARAGADREGATTVVADDACSAAGGEAAAKQFVAGKVAVVVGFLCSEALEAALPVLKDAAIPVLDVGVRADRFTARRAKTGFPVWRLAPKADAERRALEALVAARWRDQPFGILDDGSINNRETADALRQSLETAGMKPATVDTFRPAEEKQFGFVRRLERTGVTRFVVLGDRGDAAVIARDAAANGLPLELVGGEALLDEPSDAARLPAGTLAVGPQFRFPQIAPAGTALDTDRQGYYGPAFAATQVAAQAARTAMGTDRTPAAILADTAFATALGTVRFDAAGDAGLALLGPLRFDGRDFVPLSGG